MPVEEKVLYVKISTTKQVYRLELTSARFTNNGEDGDSVIAVDFIDKNEDTGTILITPTFEVISVNYDIPF